MLNGGDHIPSQAIGHLVLWVLSVCFPLGHESAQHSPLLSTKPEGILLHPVPKVTGLVQNHELEWVGTLELDSSLL